MNIVDIKIDNWSNLNKVELFNSINNIKNKINNINDLNNQEQFIFLSMIIYFIRL